MIFDGRDVFEGRYNTFLPNGMTKEVNCLRKKLPYFFVDAFTLTEDSFQVCVKTTKQYFQLTIQRRECHQHILDKICL
jgi:hypothetical protein